ncbi:MAG: SGNH/GDSL hydrolase family protein [candidate division KSB1 bacterium]|nr:SGNH/GDSL hydrolase family protein [candidate division KSB1 bacterium]MDZ7365666.1 SGNH/GDSL hydrolase family protein [candidate division KSB1 bacterium]MDZ7403258.1 SGNH/GDSL hydrolase family protein [candidate division KSB1 bacterium]
MKNKIAFMTILLVTCLTLISAQTAKPVKVIFFGDSITEVGIQPGGYIDRMRKMLAQKNLTDYQLIGAGVSGNKVYDLYLRLEEDVLSQKPDWVFIYVGVNDVWHKKSFGTGTDADKFEKFYIAVIRKLQTNGIQVALCTPAVIGEKTDGKNELDADLNKFSQIIRNLAAKYDLPLCDLRRIFMDYLAQNNRENKEKGLLTNDGVHLNDAGNQLVAEQMLKIIIK